MNIADKEKDEERDMVKWTQKELRRLPHRDWDDVAIYDSLILIPGRIKHDSGWQHIIIVGCKKRIPFVICTSCSDDLEWAMPDAVRFGPNNEHSLGQMRMDCLPISKAFHAWMNERQFKVGPALSSIKIEIIQNKKPDKK